MWEDAGAPQPGSQGALSSPIRVEMPIWTLQCSGITWGGCGHIMPCSVLIVGDNSAAPSWPRVHGQDKAVHPTQR